MIKYLTDNIYGVIGAVLIMILLSLTITIQCQRKEVLDGKFDAAKRENERLTIELDRVKAYHAALVKYHANSDESVASLVDNTEDIKVKHDEIEKEIDELKEVEGISDWLNAAIPDDVQRVLSDIKNSRNRVCAD